jgi:hypothetical protein
MVVDDTARITTLGHALWQRKYLTNIEFFAGFRGDARVGLFL